MNVVEECAPGGRPGAHRYLHVPVITQLKISIQELQSRFFMVMVVLGLKSTFPFNLYKMNSKA